MFTDSGKIICPICNKGYDRFSSHISKGHKLEWNDFINEYGEYPRCSEVSSNQMKEVGLRRTSESRSIATKKQWKNQTYRDLMLESVNRQWSDDEFVELMKETGKNTYETKLKDDPRWIKTGKDNPLHKFLVEMHNGEHPEELQKMIDGRHEYNVSEEGIRNLNSWRDDPKKVEAARDRTKRNNFGTINKYTRKDGRVVTLRSITVERPIAEYLDKLNVNWEYEPFVIYYFDDRVNRMRRYHPDFYLPDYNLIIEGKYDEDTNDYEVVLKKSATIAEGYNFGFIGRYNTSDIEKLISSATTIENRSTEEISVVVSE